MTKDDVQQGAEGAPVEGAPKADAAAADTGKKAGPKAKKAPKVDTEELERSASRRDRGRSMRARSKRHLTNSNKVDRHKVYEMDAGLKLLKEVAGGTKFVQTVNIVMNLGIDPRQADQMIRGSVSLPKGIGKTKKVIAFCEGEDAAAAKAAGAIEADIDELVKKISDGWMDFDVAIAHPRSMGKVGKLGRVLGPQGKMPSPKSGTVTPDVAKAVTEYSAGKLEYRNDSGGNIAVPVGKISFDADKLVDNAQFFVDHIRRIKPATTKGTYFKKVTLTATMTPGVLVDVN